MITFPEHVDTAAVAGDWHGDTRYACRAIMAASSADFLLHTGDFGYWFRPDYLDALNRTAEFCDSIIAFVDGNHEDFDWLLAQPVDDDGVRRLRERVWHLPRGFRWTWQGVRFLALGGAVSPDKDWRIAQQAARPGDRCWWPQEQITDADVALAIAGGPVDVMICHDVPAGVPGDALGITGNPFGFDPAILAECDHHRGRLRRVVDEVSPSRLWHGHYHRRYSHALETVGGNRCTVEGLGANNGTVADNLRVVRLADLVGA